MVKDPELPLTGVSAFLQQQKPAESAVRPSAPGDGGPAALCKRVPASMPTQPPHSGGSPLVRNVLYLAGAAGVALLALSILLTAKAKQ
jgi:hypothetical protein